MWERLASVVTLSLLLATYMNPSVTRRSYLYSIVPPDSKYEDRESYLEDSKYEDRESYLEDFPVRAPEDAIGEQVIENDAVDAKHRDAMDSSNLNEIIYQGKFDFFRTAEEVMINPFLPAGIPKNFHVPNLKSKSPRNRFVTKQDLKYIS